MRDTNLERKVLFARAARPHVAVTETYLVTPRLRDLHRGEPQQRARGVTPLLMAKPPLGPILAQLGLEEGSTSSHCGHKGGDRRPNRFRQGLPLDQEIIPAVDCERSALHHALAAPAIEEAARKVTVHVDAVAARIGPAHLATGFLGRTERHGRLGVLIQPALALVTLGAQ